MLHVVLSRAVALGAGDMSLVEIAVAAGNGAANAVVCLLVHFMQMLRVLLPCAVAVRVDTMHRDAEYVVDVCCCCKY